MSQNFSPPTKYKYFINRFGYLVLRYIMEKENGFEPDESPRNADTNNKNKKGRKKSSTISFKPLSQKQSQYAMNIAQREKAMSARSNKVHKYY